MPTASIPLDLTVDPEHTRKPLPPLRQTGGCRVQKKYDGDCCCTYEAAWQLRTDLRRRAAAVDARRSKTTATASAVKSETYVSRRIASSAPSGLPPSAEPTNRRMEIISCIRLRAPPQINNRSNGGRGNAQEPDAHSEQYQHERNAAGVADRSNSGSPEVASAVRPFLGPAPSLVRPFTILWPALLR